MPFLIPDMVVGWCLWLNWCCKSYSGGAGVGFLLLRWEGRQVTAFWMRVGGGTESMSFGGYIKNALYSF